MRYIGVSNWAAWQVSKALGVSNLQGLTKFVSLQAYYTLAARDLEREVVPMLESEDLGLLVWCPLAGGLLSGKYSRNKQGEEGSRRAAMAFPPAELNRAYNVIDVLGRLARQKHASVAQLALSWLLHQPRVTSVLLGSRWLGQLSDNLGAVDVAFAEDELQQLDEVSKLPAEYPGWMPEMWSQARVQQLADARS